MVTAHRYRHWCGSGCPAAPVGSHQKGAQGIQEKGPGEFNRGKAGLTIAGGNKKISEMADSVQNKKRARRSSDKEHQRRLEAAQQALKDSQSLWKQSKTFRTVVYVGIGIGALWGSRFIFKLTAGTIRAYKDLRKSMKE